MPIKLAAKKLNPRSLVTLAVLAVFATLLISGIWLFSLPHTSVIASIHTLFGLLLIMAVVYHMKNNFKPLKSYLIKRGKSRPSRELLVTLTLTGMISAATIFELPPFNQLYLWGNNLRANQEQQLEDSFQYQRINKSFALNGQNLTIDVRTGPYYNWPQYAIWLEDLDGNYLQTLYASNAIAADHFAYKADYQGGNNQVQLSDTQISYQPESAQERSRPEALPVWNHQRGGQTGQTIKAIASGENLDGYTGATLGNSYLLQAQADLPERFRVKMELNNSFDWNDYYHRDRFGDDPIYTGSGFVGQPSVIYEAVIDNSQPFNAMTLIGHGHHSGKDGKIYADISRLTSATKIIDRAIVEYQGNNKIELSAVITNTADNSP